MVKTLYTAVGHFERRSDKYRRSYPVIVLGGKEYMAGLQEMAVWTCLNWRIARREEIPALYDNACRGNVFLSERSLDSCMARLLARGLLVSGAGETEYDALYDLLSSLYIIPADGSMFLRLFVFCKLTLLKRVPVSAAKRLFFKDRRTSQEKQIMQLSRQALLSTAEIIKCMEKDVRCLPDEESILDSLYDDRDTTSDNISYMVRNLPCSKPIILAVANLYLRKQIILERI